jgi:hypothetical protein
MAENDAPDKDLQRRLDAALKKSLQMKPKPHKPKKKKPKAKQT